MKIAIVGFDTEGRSSYDYFAAQGHEITVCDQNPAVEVPAGAGAALGDGYLNDLDRFDLVVRTAGIPPAKILADNPQVATKLTSQINEFFRASPTRNIIGVTGTKGKGTTSTLLTRMLEAAGKHVFLGGNIGVPPLSFMPKLREDSWVVLELSSFQLSDLQYSPRIGICLMVVPEHLNWHADMDDYIAAKSRMFALQNESDIAISLAGNEISKTIASSGNGRQIPYFAAPGAYVEAGSIRIDDQIICEITDLKLIGPHNLQNACAALTAAWQVGPDPKAYAKALKHFSGLEHRLELVRTVGGVQYYDDSFGTTPETAAVAVQSFKEPKIIILGGSDKGADFAVLAQAIKDNNVRRAIIIGATGPRIIAALETAGFTDMSLGGNSLESAVQMAHEAAQPGDVVLLSTACASFDMFKNYKDRGDQFKRLVKAL
jgi:UDP-N-acetylmuramoylalanine--D-glutamate ligase